MKDMHLWLKAIKDKLSTVRVCGQDDVNSMTAVFNTLDDLIDKARQEAAQNEANNQQE
jgi:hypothetical protein